MKYSNDRVKIVSKANNRRFIWYRVVKQGAEQIIRVFNLHGAQSAGNIILQKRFRDNEEMYTNSFLMFITT